MNEYGFDVLLRAVVRVAAESEKEAREALARELEVVEPYLHCGIVRLTELTLEPEPKPELFDGPEQCSECGSPCDGGRCSDCSDDDCSDDDLDACTRCGEDTTGGDGWNGLCGDCADRKERGK